MGSAVRSDRSWKDRPLPPGQAVSEFGTAVHAFVHRAQRGQLASSLFDIPRRTEMAARAYSACVPGFVEEVVARCKPADLGRAMRRPATRPNAMHIIGIMWLLLFHREERRLRGDPAWGEHDDDIARCVEAVAAILTALHEGDRFVPLPGDPVMQILEPDTVAALAGAKTALDAQRGRSVRTLVATLELYSFMLHGEHRDGIFSHGPYPLPDGRSLLVRDFTDLDNEFLAWTSPTTALPVPDLTVALVTTSEDLELDLWGTLSTESSDYWESVEAAAVLTGAGTDPRPVEDSEAADIVARARAAQLEVFRNVARWPEEQRVSYGTSLFANHLRSIAELAGIPAEFFSAMVDDMQRAAREHQLTSERSPIWGHLASSPSPFTPLRT